MKFYDTCSLIDLQEKAFEERFYVSNLTFVELEGIKTSATKDEETKLNARRLIRLLAENTNKYETILYKVYYEDLIKKFNLIPNNDSRIIISAYDTYTNKKDLVFVTSDLSCKVNAEGIGLPTEFTFLDDIIKDDYCGYKEITMTDDELAIFYSATLPENNNKYGLLINEYLFIKQSDKVIDKYKWTNEGYKEIPFYTFDSMMFGKLKPLDLYQECVLDSLFNNKITVIRGKAGSGKSYLALSYLINQLERGHINHIVIFVNNVAVRGAAKLGFYPGDKVQKMLDSQIGNFLASKFGDITAVERMIDEGTLILVPMADCRGYDTTGMKAGILVTEAQNTSVDMLKLILQRIGEDSIAIFEGDTETQVDMSEYKGLNNGLRRVSQVFKGQDFYGETTLQIIHRSRIAAIADRM